MDEWESVYIQAFDLDDLWHKLLMEILKKGHRYTIQRGSYEGHDRIEFDNVMFTVKLPSNRPLVPSVPQGIPPPSDMNYVNEYFWYLIGTEKKDEQYTYGERISKMLPIDKREGKDISTQLDECITILKKTPQTNQAILTVGQPEDILLRDPPCLRLIDCRIRYGALHHFYYFRSWDLYSGLPNNLAALQMLKEYMAREVGVADGTINAWSKGLHLYDFQFDLAKQIIIGAKSPRIGERMSQN